MVHLCTKIHSHLGFTIPVEHLQLWSKMGRNCRQESTLRITFIGSIHSMNKVPNILSSFLGNKFNWSIAVFVEGDATCIISKLLAASRTAQTYNIGTKECIRRVEKWDDEHWERDFGNQMKLNKIPFSKDRRLCLRHLFLSLSLPFIGVFHASFWRRFNCHRNFILDQVTDPPFFYNFSIGLLCRNVPGTEPTKPTGWHCWQSNCWVRHLWTSEPWRSLQKGYPPWN